jgi:putative endonuclease
VLRGWVALLATTESGLKCPCIYIMASRRNGTLYCGVTSDLALRAFEHRTCVLIGFTKQYGCKLLIWYEPHARMDEASAREKQIKSGSRAKKLALIEAMNPDWVDLYETLNLEGSVWSRGATCSVAAMHDHIEA